MRRLRLPALRRRRAGAPTEPDPLRIGIVAVAVLLSVLLVTVGINSLHLGKATYQAQFAQAAGIAPGDAVTYVGVPVGTVTNTRLTGDHVTVTMKIDRDLPLGADTHAAVKLTTLLGSRYVELRSNGIGRLPDKRIPLAQTEVPYNLETALQDATRTFGQLDADQIATSMTALSTQLRDLPQVVPEVLGNVYSLSAVIAQRRDQIATLVTSTAQVTTVIRDQQADLAALVSRGRTVLQEINSRQDALRRLLAATTTLIHQIEPIAVGDRSRIQQLLDDLHSMTAMIAGNDALLRSILQILPVPWRLFANATGTGMELSAAAPDGAFVDSFMCALSKRAIELGRAPYHEDCK
ncbi:MCE family protein [Nocardia bovistercoris]|uniref:MCE family protein n=1 Tax=Nocardia bovistercoris TaxID=2785916 RepID=A0A931I7I8_9NOCA|nr:MCE family protein [Nocardia bovistercoris]MBH0776309.1 MCE family protein [Nocardia bovistercoris]